MMPHLPKSFLTGLPGILVALAARVPAGPDDMRAMRGIAVSVSVSAAFWGLVLVALRTL